MFEENKESNKPFAFVIMLMLILLLYALDASTEEPDVALWLARSCVGEAGYKSHATGECAAIMHIYKKRAEMANTTIYGVARKYSSVIKQMDGKRNPWVMHVHRTLEQPHKWPSNTKWAVAAPHVKKTIELADKFVLGHVDDPLPQALHYGSKIDKPASNFKQIKAPGFRNRFYKVKGVRR